MLGTKTILVSGLAAMVLAGTGCLSAGSMVIKRPQPKLDKAITELWAEEIRANAEDGDWILSRSYSFIGDVITGVTRGDDWSHASIYDKKRDVIIEATSDGVHEIPLERFVRRNYRMAIMRPAGTTAAERSAGLQRVRGKLGAKYDWTGLVGVDDPERFTCAELVFWSAEPDARGWHVPIIVAPSDLPKYGQIVFYTGTRDDYDVVVLARSASGPTLASR